MSLEKVRALKPEILKVARRFRLSPSVLAGLIYQESKGDPWATNVEERYKWIVNNPTTKPRIKPLHDDIYEQRISYGLCQVMGATARWLDRDEILWAPGDPKPVGWLTELCQVEVGLYYGGRYLRWCLNRSDVKGDIGLALERYNGNREYPGLVVRWAGKFLDFEGAL